MPYNWKKHYAIKQRFDTEYNWVPESAGIYLWTREDGKFTYFYVGQAQNLKNRLFDYYKIICGVAYPTRHFEASLKKHKDWEVRVLETCPVEELDAREKYYIDYYNGCPNYITRNELIANQDIVRSNYKRIHNVYTKYENNIKKMLKHLDFDFGCNGVMTIRSRLNKNGKDNKQSMKAYKELEQWLKGLLNNENRENN